MLYIFDWFSLINRIWWLKKDCRFPQRNLHVELYPSFYTLSYQQQQIPSNDDQQEIVAPANLLMKGRRRQNNIKCILPQASTLSILWATFRSLKKENAPEHPRLFHKSRDQPLPCWRRLLLLSVQQTAHILKRDSSNMTIYNWHGEYPGTQHVLLTKRKTNWQKLTVKY